MSKSNEVKAPNLKLMSTSNQMVELNKLKSKFVVLYFYPKDNTSGCTIETNDFNKLLSKFKKYVTLAKKSCCCLIHIDSI